MADFDILNVFGSGIKKRLKDMGGYWAEIGSVVQADASGNVIPFARYMRANGVAKLLSAAASTNLNGGGVLANARAVHKVMGRKATANSAWLKLYDKATAPVLASDVPFATIELVASATFDLDLKGYELVNGLAYAITGASGDTDTTALTAGDVLGLNIFYATA